MINMQSVQTGYEFKNTLDANFIFVFVKRLFPALTAYVGKHVTIVGWHHCTRVLERELSRTTMWADCHNHVVPLEPLWPRPVSANNATGSCQGISKASSPW